MKNNGDSDRVFLVGGNSVRGLGSFHKTLPHNEYGEVDPAALNQLLAAARSRGEPYEPVPKGTPDAARFTNPQAGFAQDRLTPHPTAFTMPPAPAVLSVSTAAEMVELYWMAALRDVSLVDLASEAVAAAAEIDQRYQQAVADVGDEGRLKPGVDLPGSASARSTITPDNIFRIGLPGEEVGPLISQFFVRDANYGTQRIDQRLRPYKAGRNYLTGFDEWLAAQRSGKGPDGNDYAGANEASEDYYEPEGRRRYIATMRDLARFVNKDALHQAYFTATLLLLSGGAQWTPGNPYDTGYLRQAGFGVLGGPHILALVSEVATRALKVVWNQKWRVHLRLRPEAYGGLVHVQHLGAGKAGTRAYGLPAWVFDSLGARRAAAVQGDEAGSRLLPMAFTPGSPVHPAYGAGHATVAGACVTVLKAYFRTLDDKGCPLGIDTLVEREAPYSPPHPFRAYLTGVDAAGEGRREDYPSAGLTIEGELNKLAANVAMGRSMGGVHWRTDNTRSLILGETLAAKILAEITTDVAERPVFRFRSFARKADGNPKHICIADGQVIVDGTPVDPVASL